MTTVPFTDLSAMTTEVWPSIETSYLTCVRQANYIGGVHVADFEREWAAYCGGGHAVGVGNGTDALELTLAALDIGHGDEVIVPANTFIATAAAVVRAGAVPRFADVSDETLLLTPETLAAAITSRTRAVMVVHLYGQSPDMDGLLKVAREAGLLVIEDAAQAHGAEWAGQRVGSFGTAACFSFYPGKNLGAFGDGGAVVTDSQDLADRVRTLANHGRSHGSAHFEHEFVGRNSRLDALAAIALRGKLACLDAWTDRKIELAARYRSRLAGTGIRLTEASPQARHVYHLLVARVPQRDWVREELGRRGIQTGIHYPVPCHLQPPLTRFAVEPLPVAERAAREVLSLPIFPHMADRQVDLVCAELVQTLASVPSDQELAGVR
jgi:dTDP-4-amino-4,6-dideoxygalactose transaminase